MTKEYQDGYRKALEGRKPILPSDSQDAERYLDGYMAAISLMGEVITLSRVNGDNNSLYQK